MSRTYVIRAVHPKGCRHGGGLGLIFHLLGRRAQKHATFFIKRELSHLFWYHGKGVDTYFW
eukprot:6776787-Prymnesium_polylepis.1